MKVSKRQLRRIIKEEKRKLLSEAHMQTTESGQQVYDEVEDRALAIIEDILRTYGSDDIVLEAMINALKDVMGELPGYRAGGSRYRG